MQRYFAKEKIENEFILNDGDIHHIKNVMRYEIGTKIEVVYEKNVYLCCITNLTPLSLQILKTYDEDREIPINLTIAIGLVNEQKFDLIIQKLTELGADTIIPVKMERSIIKLEESKQEKRIERWKKICKEASEQCHRLTVPDVTLPKTIEELTSMKQELNLICSLNGNPKHLSEYLTPDLHDILFLIGPEGGISPAEEEKLINNGFKTTTLGKRILRVETAAIYVAGIINYVYKG